MVRDINPGGPGSAPKSLTNVAGTLFLGASDGTHGSELWRSDGTRDGTSIADDINPGPTGSQPRDLTDVGGTAFFSADDGAHGRELWKAVP